MAHEKDPKIRLMRLAMRDGITQLLAATACTGILLLFVALTYSKITLPAYAAAYDQKDTQQVVNLLITVVATVIGILLSHCRRLTNEAETRSELRNGDLTIPRLHVHFEAAGGSKAAMSFPAVHNKAIWMLAVVYLCNMVVFGFVHSVLSVIFVVEDVISTEGIERPIRTIPLSVDIPFQYDPCRLDLSHPGCTYELAINYLTSLLISSEPFTVAGVEFDFMLIFYKPVNGTMGMPYYAMKHFSEEVSTSNHEEEYRRYCLPVMNPHIIKCEEESFNQTLLQTESNLVRYRKLDTSFKELDGTTHKLVNKGIYQISIPFPPKNQGEIKYRAGDEQGIFLTKAQWTPDYYAKNDTIITAQNYEDVGSVGPPGAEQAIGYGSLLYRMMYGKDPSPELLATVPSNSSFIFVAKCTFASIAEQDSHNSWRQVDFTLSSGVLRSNVTEERCPNPRGWAGISGYSDLYFTLEGACSIIAGSDGYSKLFNDGSEHYSMNPGPGTPIFAELSRLDATVNKIYHITQTSYSESTYEHAVKNPNVSAYPIIMIEYPHRYVVRISWTSTTYIGLALSLLITLNAFILFGRWIRATYRFGFKNGDTWNLLRPIDLMAYTMSWRGLIPDLRTPEQRQMAMRGETFTTLRDHPGWYNRHSPHSPLSTQTPASTVAMESRVMNYGKV